MSDRIYYSLYGFFEEIHGPGDFAEVAALFTWSALLALNLATLFVCVIAIAGTPPLVRGRIPHVFAAVGVVVGLSQYLRYHPDDKTRSLKLKFAAESAHARRQRRWTSFGYLVATVGAFCASLSLLNLLR